MPNKPIDGWFHHEQTAIELAASLNDDEGWRYSAVPTAPGSAWYVIEVRDETDVIVGYL